MRVQVLAVPYDSAHGSLRMGRGPERFLDAGIQRPLQARGHDVDVAMVEAGMRFEQTLAEG